MQLWREKYDEMLHILQLTQEAAGGVAHSLQVRGAPQLAGEHQLPHRPPHPPPAEARDGLETKATLGKL